MYQLKISIPNDYASEASMEAAIADCYDGDSEAAEADEYRYLFDALADAAKAAGLTYQSDTDYGAIWAGTAEQCAQARASLPGWAEAAEAEEEEAT